VTVVESTEIVMPPWTPRLGWGWSLAAGIAWVLVAVAVLSLDPFALSALAACVAFVIILAGLWEASAIFNSRGWAAWLHAVLALVLLVIGFLALTEPLQTFLGLSVLVGWFLILKGMSIGIVALATRAPGSLWGLVLGAGVACIALGVWALGAPQRSAALLVLWAGAGALVLGITDIVRALEQRKA